MNAAKTERARPSWFFYDFVKITAGIPGLLWYRPRLVYENEAARGRIRGGALVIANHIGFFDPVYLLITIWYRRMRFVCLQQFFDSSWSWFFRHVHCIPIDKNDVGVDSVREIIRHLRAGGVVSMFPEGHVNDGSGELDAFKSGAVLMALRGGVPVVPVYVRPKKHWYERLTMAIGAPVDVKELLGGRGGVAGLDAAAGLLFRKEKELSELIRRK